MVCSDCHNPKPVARCVTVLNIGRSVLLSTPIFVYVEDTTTERTIRYAVTTTADGTINVPITPQRFSEDHSYFVWITKQTADNIDIKEDIIISNVVNTCIELMFENIYQSDNVIAVYPNQILTL